MKYNEMIAMLSKGIVILSLVSLVAAPTLAYHENDPTYGSYSHEELESFFPNYQQEQLRERTQGLKLGPDCDPAKAPGQPDACDINAFIAWIKQIINFMFYIAIPLGVIFIVYGGFVIMTSGGSEERFNKGKQVITAAVIGLAIALGAWLIITALNFFIQPSFQFK